LRQINPHGEGSFGETPVLGIGAASRSACWKSCLQDGDVGRVWFSRHGRSAEHLIKEAGNDAGLTAHPSKRFDMNSIHF